MKLSERQFSEITRKVTENILRDYYLVPRQITVDIETKIEFLEHIVIFVGKHLDVHPTEIKSNCQTQRCVKARQLFFYLARKYSKIRVSYQFMGKFVSKDHSTTIQALQKIDKQMEVDKVFKKKMEEISQKFFDSFKEEIFNLEHPIPPSITQK